MLNFLRGLLEGSRAAVHQMAGSLSDKRRAQPLRCANFRIHLLFALVDDPKHVRQE